MPMNPMPQEVLDAIGTTPGIVMIATVAIAASVSLMTGRGEGDPRAMTPIDETMGDDHPSLWTFP